MKHVKRILMAVLKGLIMGIIIGIGNSIINESSEWWKIAIFATCLITSGELIRIIIDTVKKSNMF